MTLTQAQIDEASAFSIEIDSRKFTNWSEIELEQSIDGFSTVGFTAPFEPDRIDFRETFRPFSFKPVTVAIGGEKQFTGFLLNVEPALGGNSRSVRVQAVAAPQVLADCALPENFTGREYCGLNLLKVAEDLCSPFKIGVKFLDERSAAVESFLATAKDHDKVLAALNAKFPKVKIACDIKIHDFLCVLAKQRGVVMTDDRAGNLLFQKSVPTGNSVVLLKEGIAPLISVTPQFNPQEYYSEITAVVPTTKRRKGSRFTLQNPLLKDVLRPMTFRCESTERADAPAAAQAKLGRMFCNVVNWDVDLPVMLDPEGRHYRPNTTLTVKAPSAMIYGRHELLIRSVTKRQDANGTSCKLNVVLPGAFSGEAPVVFPWNEALSNDDDAA